MATKKEMSDLHVHIALQDQLIAQFAETIVRRDNKIDAARAHYAQLRDQANATVSALRAELARKESLIQVLRKRPTQAQLFEVMA